MNTSVVNMQGKWNIVKQKHQNKEYLNVLVFLKLFLGLDNLQNHSHNFHEPSFRTQPGKIQKDQNIFT